MKYKKKIKDDIKQILTESGVDKRVWEKVLTRLVNYTDKIRTGKVFKSSDSLKLEQI
jgi:hypothetical protein